MNPTRASRPSDMDRPPRRSRSDSYDSEEERRRRERRRRRDERDGEDRHRDKGRSRRGDGDGDGDVKEKHDNKSRWDREDRERDGSNGKGYEKDRRDDNGSDRKRRRSRSPGHEQTSSSSSRRRHDERHNSKPRNPRNRSPNPHSSSHPNNETRSSTKQGSETQISRRNKGPLPSQAASFQSDKNPGAVVPVEEQEKQIPNFAPSGLLAAASNSVAQVDGTSIVLKYHEPGEARKPPAKDEWKLFVFKGDDILESIELSRRSCWLVGRELAVVDMPAEHPSVSKQHAVIQFRYIEKKNEFGDKLGRVRPYLIDLESANGTSLNKEPIPASRYLELRDKDMIQFGESTREYVLMLSPKS